MQGWPKDRIERSDTHRRGQLALSLINHPLTPYRRDNSHNLVPLVVLCDVSGVVLRFETALGRECPDLEEMYWFAAV